MADLNESQTQTDDDGEEETDLTLVADQYRLAADAIRDGGDAGGTLHLLREDAFDHFTMPASNSWRSNVPVVDEVAEMLVKQLLDLVACLAWQEVAFQQERTSAVACARLLTTAVDGVLQHYHLKIWAQQELFSHFPEKNWPTDLLACIHELKAVLPKASWLAKTAHAELLRRSVAEQQAVLFGQHMWNLANAARSHMISHLNPHWVPACDLPSGHTRSDFIATLMDELWPGDCQRRASMSVMKSKARRNIEMTLAEKVAAVATARQKNVDAREAEWGGCWRPQSYLAWQIAGMPCGERGGTVMDTLAIARAGTDVPVTDALASRQQRRAQRK
ncbi:hypothetical protein B484DRAFT_411181 [Ochromonadaceae sp. CCMP2298]|nr:hypothetical protein B484DRAFT_411181 [Ochromonadaceae sp. CCMP2298]